MSGSTCSAVVASMSYMMFSYMAMVALLVVSFLI